MIKNKITIGADPEMFIQDNIEIVSAEGHIEGTKDAPYEIKEGFGLQLDNVACEFNIPPCTEFEEFKDSIKFSLDFIAAKLERKKLSISKESSHVFPSKFLQSENAQTFGCDPDFNAWKEEMNKAPDSVGSLRTVAGHIHIGYESMAEVNEENSENIVKAFDLFVVLPSILTDPDRTRRNLYGKAGCFRMKDYGVEVRALSNFWMFDEGKMKMIWHATQMAVDLALNRDLSEIFEKHEKDIVKAINTYDEDIAKRIITEVIEPFYIEKEELITLKKQ